jgi:hypothetical protein
MVSVRLLPFYHREREFLPMTGVAARTPALVPTGEEKRILSPLEFKP